MRVPFFIVALAAALAVASGRVPATAQTAQTQTRDFNGSWNVTATGPHFRNGVYELKQVNQTVIGSNLYGGQMNGTMKPTGIVEGTWRGPTGETGWFNLQMGPDGKSFSGEYGYGGRKPEGKLIGRLGKAGR